MKANSAGGKLHRLPSPAQRSESKR